MAVWHGAAGGIRLTRSGGDTRMYDRVNPADVNPARRRLGFVGDLSTIITGDRVWLRRVEDDGTLSASPLAFIAGWTYPDWQGFAHVDAVGGIALYETWEEAIAGEQPTAIALTQPPSGFRVSIDVTNPGGELCLAQVTKFTLTTTRQLEDVTAIGAGFSESSSTLAGGVGSIELLWDVGSGWPCEGYEDVEKAAYLHRVVLRQQAGASFRGVFLLKREFEQPLDLVLSDRYAQRELFYEADCQIVSAQATVDVNDIIRSSIQFQTTGPVLLKYQVPFSALLLEQSISDRVLTESGDPIRLEFLD